MPFVDLHTVLPELAEAETRFITTVDYIDGLPPDKYAMREFYCDEPGCDCRRVLLSVVAAKSMQPFALISFGWEPIEFYENWSGFVTPGIARMLKGPELNVGSPQSPYADTLLDLIEEMAFDPEYIKRLERHYYAFREALNRGARSIAGDRADSLKRRRMLRDRKLKAQRRSKSKRRR